MKNKKKKLSEEEEFAKYLEKIEDPNYQGGSWALPENPTPLEKSKHELCREILIYQQKRKLTDEELANQMELTVAETEDILYYRISYFTLDRLMTYANKLFKSEPLMIGVIKDKELYDKRRTV